ncbi:hypothetical protein RUM44_006476 [Polyplax serrata]|uniref:G-protein coupled receptors family 3 profile domain-containing protein n=1 Tax=Polyplax serrata TaxID=468196 RepID=A0ABR1AJY5_POLSC
MRVGEREDESTEPSAVYQPIQIASMCMCINISATVALGCLFTPKVYIVMFQPSKNVRQSNAPNSGAGRAAYSMKFTGCRSQTAHSVQSVTSGSRSSPRSSNHAANGETNCSPSAEELNMS